MNARSCKNKTTEINDLIVEKNADVVFISETWLKDNDNITVTALLPNNFDIVYSNRKSRTGGGVAIIYRNCLKVLPTSYVSNDFTSFESCHLKVETPDSKICFFSCIYRPPNSAKFNLPFSTFIQDFNDLCENLSNEQNIYIFGDFNFHFEKTDDKAVNDFKILINEHDFEQSINVSTHIKGHILDLCLYRCADSAFIEFPSVTDNCISDHFVITASLPFSKPKHLKQTAQRRNTASIDLNDFQCALSDSIADISNELTSFSFSNCLTSVLDKFAPIKNKIIALRPAAPWINLVVKAQKQIKRRAERLFRKTRLTVHKQIYQYHKNKTIKIIDNEKKKYISEQISNSTNSKRLYSVLKSVTAKSNSLTLPSDTPHQNLPDLFNHFFIDKISKIRHALDSVDCSASQNPDIECKFCFNSFSPVDQECVRKIIM